MAVAVALTLIAEIPKEPRKSIVTTALAAPVKLPSPFSTKLGAAPELPFGWNSAVKVFCAVPAELPLACGAEFRAEWRRQLHRRRERRGYDGFPRLLRDFRDQRQGNRDRHGRAHLSS